MSEEKPDRVLDDGTVVITSAAGIERFRLLAIRGRLGLETKGLKFKGGSMRKTANEMMGTNHRTLRATYAAFNEWCEREHGIPKSQL